VKVHQLLVIQACEENPVSGTPFMLTLSANSSRAAQTYLIMGIKIHLVPPLVDVCP
jgi:hypothetical protein